MKPQLLFVYIAVAVLLFSCVSEDEPFCSAPRQVTVVAVSESEVTLNFVQETTENFSIEYGLSGFKIGEGQLIEDTGNNVTISELEANTQYDIYITAKCTDTLFSAISEKTTVITLKELCPAPIISSVFVIDYNEAIVSWNKTENEISWFVEYGTTGFVLGNGIEKPAFKNELLIDALVVGTTYDVYIKAICEGMEESFYSDVFTFTTRACVPPTKVIATKITNNSFVIGWNGQGEVTWELEYGIQGFSLGNGAVIFTGDIPVTIDNLQSQTTYDVYIRANCGPNGRSEYVGPITVSTL